MNLLRRRIVENVVDRRGRTFASGLPLACIDDQPEAGGCRLEGRLRRLRLAAAWGKSSLTTRRQRLKSGSPVEKTVLWRRNFCARPPVRRCRECRLHCRQANRLWPGSTAGPRFTESASVMGQRKQNLFLISEVHQRPQRQPPGRGKLKRAGDDSIRQRPASHAAVRLSHRHFSNRCASLAPA